MSYREDMSRQIHRSNSGSSFHSAAGVNPGRPGFLSSDYTPSSGGHSSPSLSQRQSYQQSRPSPLDYDQQRDSSPQSDIPRPHSSTQSLDDVTQRCWRLMDDMSALQAKNDRLEGQIRRMEREKDDGRAHSSSQRDHQQSQSFHRPDNSQHHNRSDSPPDVKPTVAAAIVRTREQTDSSAEIWWKTICQEPQPERRQGFSDAGWALVSSSPVYDSHTPVISAHATHLHNSEGHPLLGGSKPSPEWTETMNYAKSIVSVLYESGVVSTQQVHRDLAGLVIERNCATTRGVAPGEMSGRNEVDSPSVHAPMEYRKAGVLACAIRDLATTRRLGHIVKVAKRVGAPLAQTRKRPARREPKIGEEWARLQSLPKEEPQDEDIVSNTENSPRESPRQSEDAMDVDGHEQVDTSAVLGKYPLPIQAPTPAPWYEEDLPLPIEHTSQPAGIAASTPQIPVARGRDLQTLGAASKTPSCGTKLDQADSIEKPGEDVDATDVLHEDAVANAGPGTPKAQEAIRSRMTTEAQRDHPPPTSVAQPIPEKGEALFRSAFDNAPSNLPKLKPASPLKKRASWAVNPGAVAPVKKSKPEARSNTHSSTNPIMPQTPPKPNKTKRDPVEDSEEYNSPQATAECPEYKSVAETKMVKAKKVAVKKLLKAVGVMGRADVVLPTPAPHLAAQSATGSTAPKPRKPRNQGAKVDEEVSVEHARPTRKSLGRTATHEDLDVERKTSGRNKGPVYNESYWSGRSHKQLKAAVIRLGLEDDVADLRPDKMAHTDWMDMLKSVCQSAQIALSNEISAREAAEAAAAKALEDANSLTDDDGEEDDDEEDEVQYSD
ncbi:hypothetical protein P7C70_g3469, partial [Phenoliferia sp. Uapishka_3]